MAKIEKGTRPIGRKKGTPNKMTQQVKDMVVEALHKAGGVDYLLRQAKAEPKAFLILLGKVLPLQVKHSGDADSPIQHKHTVSPAVQNVIDSLAGKGE